MYRSGHNELDSKKSVVFPDLLATIRLTTAFVGFSVAFSQNPISQFSRNSVSRLCLYFFIRRRIEVVITGLTRNQLGSNPPRVRISPSPPIEKASKQSGFAGFFFFWPWGKNQVKNRSFFAVLSTIFEGTAFTLFTFFFTTCFPFTTQAPRFGKCHSVY